MMSDRHSTMPAKKAGIVKKVMADIPEHRR